jgi:hypothetical protein
VVPLTGVVLDRNHLPPGATVDELPFRPVVAAESPENPEPGRRAPDR